MQLNLKLTATELQQFRALCADRGMSLIEGFRAMLGAFSGVVPTTLASSDAIAGLDSEQNVNRECAESPEVKPAPVEVAEMREELAAVHSAFPRIVEHGGPPTAATARNVLAYARRSVPEAKPSEVAWYLRTRVKHGAHWRTWGGVVVAAGDYAGCGRQIAPIAPVAGYKPEFEVWRAGREATEELWAAYLAD